MCAATPVVRVFECADGCWWVDGDSGTAAPAPNAWTALHPIVRLAGRVAATTAAEGVDDIVLDLMAQRGIECVRGGSFADVVLEPTVVATIAQHVGPPRPEGCDHCGAMDHTAAACAWRPRHGTHHPFSS